MATFTEVLNKRPPSEQLRTNERISALATKPIGVQAFRNIYSEHRLTEVQWNRVIDELLNEPSIGPGFIKLRLTGVLRNMTHPTGTFPAAPIALPPTTIFGRGVPYDVVARRLSRRAPRFSPQTIRKEITYILHTKTLPAIRTLWAGRPLGSHLMWSTFSLTGSPPFEHAFKSAREFRACMGLPDENKPLLLLDYQLPPGVEVHYPTIAEAYAGDEWNFHFSPSPPVAAAGSTLPWSNDYDSHHEVVHSVIGAEQLHAKPRRLG